MESLTQQRSCLVSTVAVALVPVVVLRRAVDRSLDVLVPRVVSEVLRRVDLDAVVEEILDAVDLPGIIRDSTGVMMSDSVWRARMRGVAADDAVARLRDRLSHRRP